MPDNYGTNSPMTPSISSAATIRISGNDSPYRQRTDALTRT
jgi:hypothetical protein